ncbi:MAG: ATP-binding protein [Actinomycetota bacterium]
MAKNPFTPTFGVSPPLLVGRSDLLDEFAEALEEGPGSPGRATLYTGPRGTGKTVMLNQAGEIAEERGWLVIHETADAGLLDRLAREHLPLLLDKFDPAATTTRLRGLTGPMGIGVAWESEDDHDPAPGLRTQLTLLCECLKPQETGVLITLDEINRTHVDDLRRLATTIQHLFREEREVAFVGAGLPSAVSAILNEDVLTFLARADQHTLGPVATEDVMAALVEPITAGGRTISGRQAARAAEATGGYPFLIQLVGYHIWRQSSDVKVISAGDVTAGIAQAERRLGKLVFEPTLKGLSDVDRTFLVAMARDDEPSAMSDIAERMGVDSKYASVYRGRLIEGGVIEPAEQYGRVRFTNPYLRDYLREHVAYHAQGRTSRRGGRQRRSP